MRKIILDKEMLYRKYIEENKTVQEISDEIEISVGVISRNLKENGIEIKSNKIPPLDKNGLENLYSLKKLSIRDIAKILKVPETQIRKSLKFHNIPRRKKSWKSKYSKNGKNVACSICGKMVYRKRYTLNKYDIFFCSWECEKKHQSISRRVSELPESWRSRSEYKTWRRCVLDRDVRTCKICGSKKNPVAHHIVEAQDSPDLRYDINNGITLCKKCHIAIHVKDSHRFIESLQEAIPVE